MKDHVDLGTLLTEGALDPIPLHRAAEATFARRQLAVPGTTPLGLSDAFAQDAVNQSQRFAFLKKNRLQALDLTPTVTLLRDEFEQLLKQDWYGWWCFWWCPKFQIGKN